MDYQFKSTGFYNLWGFSVRLNVDRVKVFLFECFSVVSCCMPLSIASTITITITVRFWSRHPLVAIYGIRILEFFHTDRFRVFVYSYMPCLLSIRWGAPSYSSSSARTAGIRRKRLHSARCCLFKLLHSHSFSEKIRQKVNNPNLNEVSFSFNALDGNTI